MILRKIEITVLDHVRHATALCQSKEFLPTNPLMKL